MGYQESWFYIEPQHKFKKLIQAYEKAEQSGYYEVAGAEPHSVIVLKQPFGDIPAGKKLLWVCGDSGFHCAAGVFGGELKCSGRLRVIPVEAVLDGTEELLGKPEETLRVMKIMEACFESDRTGQAILCDL